MSFDGEPQRRRELASFLRSRRERLSPADVGFPSAGRRRTPGLRREELALLSGISATWYTSLEQARPVRPSDQVLGALAEALRLNAPERDHLFSLAGTGARAGDEVDDIEIVDPLVARLPQLVAPNPAYVTGIGYDVLGWNEAAAELFGGLVTRRAPNLARWIFADPEAREVLVDWEEIARGVLARLRGVAGRHPANRRIAALADELQASSTEARAWWPRYDIQTSRAGIKRLRHPRLGELTLSHTSFHPAEDPEQTLVVYSVPNEPGDA